MQFGKRTHFAFDGKYVLLESLGNNFNQFIQSGSLSSIDLKSIPSLLFTSQCWANNSTVSLTKDTPLTGY